MFKDLRNIVWFVRSVSGAYGRRVRRAGPAGRAAWIGLPIVALLMFCGLAARGAPPAASQDIAPTVALTERDWPAVPPVTPARVPAAVLEPTAEPVPPVSPPAETSAPPAETSASPAAVAGPVQPVDGACPDDAPIKGNHDSLIYHVPGGRSYSRTKPEQCFRTAADAEAQGYRAAKR